MNAPDLGDLLGVQDAAPVATGPTTTPFGGLVMLLPARVQVRDIDGNYSDPEQLRRLAAMLNGVADQLEAAQGVRR